MNQSQQFPVPRRQNTDSSSTTQHQPDELHMSGMSPTNHRPISHHHSNSHSHYQQDSIPNILQPGPPTGQGPPSQGQATPSKPSLNMSHSYSRSSPTNAPGYHPYTPTTPGGASSSSHFMSPSDVGRYNPPNTRTISNTPLGLADIRPRADSSMSDFAPGTLGYDIANTQPGTSNHMASWPIYAFDWCKWRPQGNSAGKLAIGSYLEDGHNFVRPLFSALIRQPDFS